MIRTALLLLACALAACKGYRAPHFDAPQKLGGQVVPAGVLTSGARAYALYCRSCHGDKGDGKGTAARGLRPPPRDFTLGMFKFGAVPAGSLPHDEDLERIVRTGLHGTAMLAWDGIPQPTVREIIQYVKTFSPRWKDEEPGEAITPTDDPWKDRAAEGVARGRKVYHGLARCQGCHPAFASKPFIYAATKELSGSGSADFRDDMYGSEVKESEFGVKLLPPDFTRSELRSIREDHRIEDLYRVIASGVGGTAMPTWHGSLPEEEIWALVHYVDSLVALKGTNAARRLVEENLAADARWTPPQEPAQSR
ncbi:MAG TPA: c-type cytochrome [Actinomycetota bacterium]|nr:c-type cytochrome [Gemmatimonadales bacterium]HYU57363.1 c-type cytochrome [Actinomycetota bacterium]